MAASRSPRARLLHIRDDAQLWEIATVHLPALEPVIRRMITELDKSK